MAKHPASGKNGGSHKSPKKSVSGDSTAVTAPSFPTTRAFDLRAYGHELRHTLRRRDQEIFTLPDDRDPVAILVEQNARRLQDLVPVRMGRMLQSPFSYYRGTAGPMAYDLTASPTTNLRVVSCGDAHISNFGFFASPERALLFDLNDFDEGAVAPWEWDLKRLAASVHIGGRDSGLTEEQCAEATRAAVVAYQNSLSKLMKLTAMERFYLQVNVEQVESFISDPNERKLAQRLAKKAKRRTSDQVLGKMTTQDKAGKRVIVDQPPITRHVDAISLEELTHAYLGYIASMREDSAALLTQFDLVDFVLRVVGVGSVGTRCYVALLEGPAGEPLFLQMKEATTSVLVRYGGMPPVIMGKVEHSEHYRLNAVPIHNQGHRVVAAQRVLQAQSDPFLGWYEYPVRGQEPVAHSILTDDGAADGGDESRVYYYFRQFRDMKGSVDLGALNATQFTRYVELCGNLLARAHSQSPLAHAVTGYVGSTGKFAKAIASWAKKYADQCERDFEALQKAAKKGVIPVETGV